MNVEPWFFWLFILPLGLGVWGLIVLMFVALKEVWNLPPMPFPVSAPWLPVGPPPPPPNG